MLQIIVFSTLNGVLYGMLLFMLASGLTLVFSMMGVLNFAHASFYMLGAYFGFEGDPVAMAHPDRIALPDLPDAVGERRRYDQLDLGAAEFAVMAGLDLAAELMRHGLLAVADAEHRQAGLVDRHRGERASLSSTEAGPPERMMPFGFISRSADLAF